MPLGVTVIENVTAVPKPTCKLDVVMVVVVVTCPPPPLLPPPPPHAPTPDNVASVNPAISKKFRGRFDSLKRQASKPRSKRHAAADPDAFSSHMRGSSERAVAAPETEDAVGARVRVAVEGLPPTGTVEGANEQE